MHKQLIKPYYLLLYTLLIVLAASCGGKQTLRGVFTKQTPYERYATSLKNAKLHETALGSSWIEAGEKALQDSLTITLPFKETGYFAADKPKAISYRFEAKRGEKIVVSLETKTREATQVFLDLFEVPPGRTAPKHIANADTADTMIEFEVNNDLLHLLRLQPELLRSGQYTLTIRVQPTLAFPIPGRTSRNISSVWGDPRDAGARRHEGIDIFAPRGTPVIASVAGTVRRVGTTPRGGNIIWLSDGNRRQNLYYAHLDEYLVAAGQQVNVGDTLGLVGNTGNAKTTAPHLHFGIYRSGQGATNPYPYVHEHPTDPPAITSDLTKLGDWVRISSKVANVRLQPSTKSQVYISLPQHTPLQVLGGTSSWYRVQLPNGAEGYVATSVVEGLTKPVSYQKIAAETDLLDEAHPLAPPKDSLAAGASVAVLATFNEYRLVRNDAGETGWIYSGR